MAQITLDGVTKRYPDGYEAVTDMSLEIEDGEFVILVGPVRLRQVDRAADDRRARGHLRRRAARSASDVVNDKAPKDRDIAMVFQNYALYPHMTVRDNMGFALKLRGADKAEIDEEGRGGARRSSTSSSILDRKPAKLSGGQRQRVAMGRAIVRDPAPS